MQHNNEKNYYLLFFGGQYSYQLTNELVSWGLYKVTDGNVTILKEQLQSEDVNKKYIGTSGDAKLTLWYNNGNISFNVDYNGNSSYYSGSYTDENSYLVYGNDSGIQLVASSCGNSAYPIYFNDVSIESYMGYVSKGEPYNIMYAQIPVTVSENVADLNGSRHIRKLIYRGSLSDGVVYVSNDGKVYDKLVYLSDFKDKVWVNVSKQKSFKYVKFADIDNLIILDELDETDISVTSSPITVYARINEFRRIGTTKPSSYITGIYRKLGAYEGSGMQHMFVKGLLPGQDPDVQDVSDLFNCCKFVENKQNLTLKDGCIGWRYHMGFSALHDLSRIPKKHRHIEDWSIHPNGVTGHNGSHPFLVDDFVRAVLTGKLPPNNAWDAANYTLPGIIAHQSAMQNGKTLKINHVGRPPEDWELITYDKKDYYEEE